MGNENAKGCIECFMSMEDLEGELRTIFLTKER